MKKLLVIVFASLLFAAPAAFAASIKSVEHRIELAGVQHVEINNGVGTITIRRTGGRLDNNSVAALEVEIDGEKSGWFNRDKDVSNMDVKIERSGNKLIITFDEDDVKADFTLEMPDPEHLTVNLGVGEIDAETGYSHVDMTLGVGDISIDSMAEAVSTIAMDVGVGDVHVSGATNTNSSRAIVAESLTAESTGQYRIRVDVGVGDARVSL